MTLLLALVSLLIGLVIGSKLQEILVAIRAIKINLNRLEKAEEPETDEAVFVEPATEAELARRELEDKIRRLNE